MKFKVGFLVGSLLLSHSVLFCAEGDSKKPFDFKAWVKKEKNLNLTPKLKLGEMLNHSVAELDDCIKGRRFDFHNCINEILVPKSIAFNYLSKVIGNYNGCKISIYQRQVRNCFTFFSIDRFNLIVYIPSEPQLTYNDICTNSVYCYKGMYGNPYLVKGVSAEAVHPQYQYITKDTVAFLCTVLNIKRPEFIEKENPKYLDQVCQKVLQDEVRYEPTSEDTKEVMEQFVNLMDLLKKRGKRVEEEARRAEEIKKIWEDKEAKAQQELKRQEAAKKAAEEERQKEAAKKEAQLHPKGEDLRKARLAALEKRGVLKK